MNRDVLLIGEAGVNHNGCEQTAMQLVELAARARVDFVKFQIFNTEQLTTKSTPKAGYQKGNGTPSESQSDMLAKLELSLDAHRRIARQSSTLGIAYLATAFDEKSLRFLAEDIDSQVFKVSSGDLTNAPFLLAHAKYKRKIILSTGMSTLGEIEDALGVLAFGLLDCPGKPSIAAFREAYRSADGLKILKKFVTLLHCTTEYPTCPEQVNIAAIKTMRTAFNMDVGFSDHTECATASVMAVAYEASVIEKHFTLDKAMQGPDHKASMAPEEFIHFVKSVRCAQTSLGDGIKKPALSEVENIHPARRSLVATARITKGDIFTVENVGAKRPGSGVSPFKYWELLGSVSERAYIEGELI